MPVLRPAKPQRNGARNPNLCAVDGAEILPDYEKAELMGQPARSETDSTPRANELYR